MQKKIRKQRMLLKRWQRGKAIQPKPQGPSKLSFCSSRTFLILGAVDPAWSLSLFLKLPNLIRLAVKILKRGYFPLAFPASASEGTVFSAGWASAARGSTSTRASCMAPPRPAEAGVVADAGRRRRGGPWAAVPTGAVRPVLLASAEKPAGHGRRGTGGHPNLQRERFSLGRRQTSRGEADSCPGRAYRAVSFFASTWGGGGGGAKASTTRFC